MQHNFLSEINQVVLALPKYGQQVIFLALQFNLFVHSQACTLVTLHTFLDKDLTTFFSNNYFFMLLDPILGIIAKS
jgi:hypothetical protein